MPGTYTARLVTGGTQHDSKFEVVLDPELHVEAADLQKQFDVSRELRDMQGSVNATLARVASVRNTAPELARRAAGLLTRPANLRSETGPRLKENLEALATMIDSVNAAPTQAQMKYFEELKAQFQDAMKQVNALFAQPGSAPVN